MAHLTGTTVAFLVVDAGLVSSLTPDHLPAFNAERVEERGPANLR